MKRKLIIAVVTGFLPLLTLGDATNSKSSVSGSWGQTPIPRPLDGATNQVPRTLRLKVTCQSGTVVMLKNATLVEQGLRKEGVIPPPTGGTAPPAVRLNMPDGGTVTILWDDIEKIAVGDRAPSEQTYAIEVTLKNAMGTKVGKTYGHDNTIVGQSDAGEFSIELKDVKEIVALPQAEK